MDRLIEKTGLFSKVESFFKPNWKSIKRAGAMASMALLLCTQPAAQAAEDKLEGWLDLITTKFPECEVSGRAHIPGDPTPLDISVEFKAETNLESDIIINTVADKPKHRKDNRNTSWAVPIPPGFRGGVEAYVVRGDDKVRLPEWQPGGQWLPEGNFAYCDTDSTPAGNSTTNIGSGINIELGQLTPIMGRHTADILGASIDGHATSIPTEDNGNLLYFTGLRTEGESSFVARIQDPSLDLTNSPQRILDSSINYPSLIPARSRVQPVDGTIYQAAGAVIRGMDGTFNLLGHKESAIGNFQGVSFGHGLFVAQSTDGINFTEPQTFLSPGYGPDHQKDAGQGYFHIQAIPFSPEGQTNQALLIFDNWPAAHDKGGTVVATADLKDIHGSIRFFRNGSFSSKNPEESILIPRTTRERNIWHMSANWLIPEGRLVLIGSDFSHQGDIIAMVSSKSLSEGNSVEQIVDSLRESPIATIYDAGQAGWGVRYTSVIGQTIPHMIESGSPVQIIAGANKPVTNHGLDALPAVFPAIFHSIHGRSPSIENRNN